MESLQAYDKSESIILICFYVTKNFKSMKSILTLLVIVILSCSISCSRTKPEVSLDISSIESELRAFESAHRSAIDLKDINAVLQFYSTDLITVSPDEPILYGRDWITNVLTDLYNEYEFQEDFKLKDIKIIGDRVVAVNEFTQQMTSFSEGDKFVQTGKGICILKKSETGTWQFEWNAYTYDSTQPDTKEK